MRHRSRPSVAAAALALAAPLVAGASGPAGTVELTVTGLRSDEGQVLICLTREPAHFPDCSGSTSARTAIIPASRPEVTFGSLPQGRYAIAVLHDENGNGRVDKALGMIPREGFGFSRDARVTVGPPKFDRAAFAMDGDRVAQRIRMRYML